MKLSELNDDDAVILCYPTYMPHVENVTIKKCNFCGQEVWFADSTQKMIGDRKFYLVCTKCAIDNVPKETLVQMPNDEQLREVAERVGKPFEDVKKRITEVIKGSNMAARAGCN